MTKITYDIKKDRLAKTVIARKADIGTKVKTTVVEFGKAAIEESEIDL